MPEIDIAELERRRADGVVLIDVREPDEYEEARVPGAVLIPLATLPDRLAEVPEEPVCVICAAGGRSRKAVEFLVRQGRDATNIAGGTKAWVASGRRYEAGDVSGGEG